MGYVGGGGTCGLGPLATTSMPPGRTNGSVNSARALIDATARAVTTSNVCIATRKSPDPRAQPFQGRHEGVAHVTQMTVLRKR